MAIIWLGEDETRSAAAGGGGVPYLQALQCKSASPLLHFEKLTQPAKLQSTVTSS